MADDPRLGEGCGFASVPLRECVCCGRRAICTDDELAGGPACPGCRVVGFVVNEMEHVEAFRDLCMTSTTVEEKFGLMGEVIGSILNFLVDHPEHLRALHDKAVARG